jgi:hypothetical protein
MTSAERHQAAVGLLVLWTAPADRAVDPLAEYRPRERVQQMLPGEPLNGLRTAAVERRRVRQE